MNVPFLTKALAYTALALVLAVVCVSLILLLQTGKKWVPLLCLALAAVIGYLLMSLLLRLSLGLVCYRPFWQTLLCYGAVIALLIWFLRDAVRQLRAESACKKEADGHDR